MWVPCLGFLTLTTLLSGAIAVVPCLNIEKDLKDHWGNDIKPRVRSYSSNLALTEPTCIASFTDDHLIWLAAKGYEDMLAKYRVDHPRENRVPGAMALFAPEGERKIYLGSSVKGVVDSPQDFFVHEKLLEWFHRCGPHRTDGSCGEFSVLQSYFDTHRAPDCTIPPNSRIVAWVNGKLRPPCSDDANGVGCRKLVNDFQLKAIEPTTNGITKIGTGNHARYPGTPPEGLQFVGRNDRNTREGAQEVMSRGGQGQRTC